MFLIWLLQFEQEDVNEPRSKGEIAYPPRFIFTAIPTEHASFCFYELELEGMSKTLKFPFPLYLHKRMHIPYQEVLLSILILLLHSFIL